MIGNKIGKLSFNLLWKVTLITIVSFLIIGSLSIRKAKLYNRENMIKNSAENLNELLYVVANINSVVMQQMRVYTKFNEITSTSSDPIAIQNELVRIKPQIYKDIQSISYIDYATGLEYRDDGSVNDISNYGFFLTLKENRQKNYDKNKKPKADQMYTEEIEPDIYGICKEPDVFNSEGLTVGCYIGRISINGYLQRFLDKLKGGTDSEIGFPVILSSDLKFICAPEKEKNFNGKHLSDFYVSQSIKRYVANPYEKDENGKKVTLSGDFRMKNINYSITVGLFSKTSWVLGIITPYSTFDKAANHTIKFIIIYGIITLILSLLIIYACFWREFKPLKVLNNSFKQLSTGEADLTQRLSDDLKRSTEIGDIEKSFNEYISNLQMMIKEIAEINEDVSNRTGKIVLILSKIKDGFKTVDNNIKLLKERNLENDIIDKIDKSSAHLDFLIPEIEVEIKDIYEPLGRLSSAIEGFKYK